MNIAVIFAGGYGARMGNAKPKQFLELYGKPVLIYTLELFELHDMVDAIVVVCVKEWIPKLKRMLATYELQKVRTVVPGGESTQASIYNGLVAAEAIAGGEDSVVLVHDGVRPLITADTITENVRMVKERGSCITCAMPTETVVLKKNEGDFSVPHRTEMIIARAPQSFWLKDILRRHRQAKEEGKVDFIDCCEMMHHFGEKLHLVMGPEENIKITTPKDFYMFEGLMKMREAQSAFG